MQMQIEQVVSNIREHAKDDDVQGILTVGFSMGSWFVIGVLPNAVLRTYQVNDKDGSVSVVNSRQVPEENLRRLAIIKE